MARGDVVNGILSATGNYQPAAGVEVIITCLGDLDASDYWYINDGSSREILPVAANPPHPGIRVPITNGRYLRFVRVTIDHSAYGGIQTK